MKNNLLYDMKWSIDVWGELVNGNVEVGEDSS